MVGRAQQLQQQLSAVLHDRAATVDPALSEDARGAKRVKLQPEESGTRGMKGPDGYGAHRQQPMRVRKELERSLAASRADLVAALESQGWELTPHSAVPGVLLMEQRRDYSQALLVQDACYLFLDHTTPEVKRSNGVWFSRETLGPDPRHLAALEVASDEDATAAAGGDSGEAPGLAEGIHGLSSGLVRDFSQIEGCSLPQSQPSSDILQSENNLDSHPTLQAPGCETVMHMAGPRLLREFVHETSEITRRFLRSNNSGVDYGDVAIVGQCDTHVGHFGQCILPMLEAAQHIVTAKPDRHATAGASSAQQGVPPSNITVFFPADKVLNSDWSVGITQLMFSTASRLMPGRVPGPPVCFRSAIFLLNARQLSSSVDLLHQRSWGMVDWVRVALEPEQPSASPIQDTIVRSAADAEVERLRAAGKVARMKGVLDSFTPDAGLASRGGRTAPQGKFQVTVVERVGKRLISNMDAVVAAVQKLFPQLPVRVLRFEGASLSEQIMTMKHTALLVSMHGATLSNVVFLPRGSVLLELFPYLFRYGRYRYVAQVCGIKHLKWENKYYANSTYIDNCMEEKGYNKLSVSQCRQVRDCKLCVRDRSITAVHIKGLAGQLRKAQALVQDFLESV